MANDNLKPDESDDERPVEFWPNGDTLLIPVEDFLRAFMVIFYKPNAGDPDEPARILPADDFWKRARLMRDGGPLDRDVAATKALEELRCAFEEAVRAGRVIPRYEDTLKMRKGLPLRKPYEPFVRVYVLRAEFEEFLHDEAPTIRRSPVETADPLTPDTAPASDVVPPTIVEPVVEASPPTLIGDDSPLWDRKNGKGAAWWTTAELAEVLRLHGVLKARRVRDPTAQLAAELGVSTKTIFRHLEAAKKAETPSEHPPDHLDN